MLAGAVTTLVNAIAVNAMAEGGRLVTDQDGGRDGVGSAFSTATGPAYIVAVKCVVVCIGRVKELAEGLTEAIQRAGEEANEE